MRRPRGGCGGRRCRAASSLGTSRPILLPDGSAGAGGRNLTRNLRRKARTLAPSAARPFLFPPSYGFGPRGLSPARLAFPAHQRLHDRFDGGFGGSGRDGGCGLYIYLAYASDARFGRSHNRAFGFSNKAFPGHGWSPIQRREHLAVACKCRTERFRSVPSRKHSAGETFSTQHKGERCYEQESQETR